MKRIAVFGLFLVTMLIPSTRALGWMRLIREDAKLVGDSELIVVGRLQAGSVCYILKADGGRPGWETRVTLLITEVLKGTCKKKEVPILIHYGLTPIVGGHVNIEGKLEMDVRSRNKSYPKSKIEVYDTGSSLHGGPSLVADARDDNLWFLRKSSGHGVEGAVAEVFGIAEPEELAPSVLKPYYQALLAADPEKALKELLGRTDRVGKLAECYLDLQEVRRIQKLADPAERAAKLRPFHNKADGWWRLEEPERRQRKLLYYESEVEQTKK
jgi:hypothetical protein